MSSYTGDPFTWGLNKIYRPVNKYFQDRKTRKENEDIINSQIQVLKEEVDRIHKLNDDDDVKLGELTNEININTEKIQTLKGEIKTLEDKRDTNLAEISQIRNNNITDENGNPIIENGKTIKVFNKIRIDSMYAKDFLKALMVKVMNLLKFVKKYITRIID